MLPTRPLNGDFRAFFPFSLLSTLLCLSVVELDFCYRQSLRTTLALICLAYSVFSPSLTSIHQQELPQTPPTTHASVIRRAFPGWRRKKTKLGSTSSSRFRGSTTDSFLDLHQGSIEYVDTEFATSKQQLHPSIFLIDGTSPNHSTCHF